MDVKICEDNYFSKIIQINETSAPLPVIIGSTCNLNCVHCLEKESASADIAGDVEATLETLKRAASNRIPAICFSGGEPTLQKNLPALISIAKELSIPFVGVRTNAMTLSYPTRAEKLRDKGLSFVKISNYIADPTTFERLSRTPGSHRNVEAGILNAIEAGLDVSVSILLMKETFSSIAENIDRLLTCFSEISAIELRIAGKRADICDTVDALEMERVFPPLVEQAFTQGVYLTLAPFEGVPPCLFSNPESMLQIFRYPSASYYPRRAFTKAPDCAACPLDSLCNGAREEYSRHLIQPGFKPPGQRLSAAVVRSSVLKTKDKSKAALREKLPADDNAVTISCKNSENGETIVKDCIVRTNFKCNQDCIFCFVDTYAPDPPDEILKKTAEELKNSRKTISIVSFSGGEPTLNPRLPEFVAMFREAGALEVCIQTNGALLSDPERARDLAACRVDSAFVSLHSHDETVSDIITGLPGAFRKTLSGIENLTANGIFVYLSHVINSFNFSTLPEFARFVAQKLGRIPIVFSFAAPHTNEMMFGGSIPSISVVRVPLREALEICLNEKIPFSGLPGMCGLPLCALGPDLRFYPDIHRVSQESIADVMRKNSDCDNCLMNDWCYGVREFYAAARGFDEMIPMTDGVFSPKPRNIDNRLEFFRTFYD